MRQIFFTLLICALTAVSVSAQKIAYVDVEYILAYMPETKAMQQEIQTFEQKLGERLQVKQQYAQTKVAEYQEAAQGGASEADLKPLQEELQKLDQEIQQESQKAQQQALAKRNEKLAPITKKVSEAIDAVANAKGYSIVLNTRDGSGTSIVLYGPDEHNITKAVFDKLGLKAPETASGQ